MGVVLKTEGQKKPRVLHDQHSSPSSVVPRQIPAKLESPGELKAEVFTVFVGGNNEKISALCGTILIKDGGEIFSIYNRKESDYELLSDNCLATIEVNYRPIQNCYFDILLNLRDPIGKRQVSYGSISVNFTNIMSANIDNTRLCSVVRGKDGYAAVNYAIFDNGFEAYLDVKVFANFDSDTPINLYGSLIARYGGHVYSTSYREKYFTSKLFDCPRDRKVEVKNGFGIPMLKSIVVLPRWSYLVIEAKLWASGISNVDDSAVGIAEFEIDLCSTTPMVIKGKNFYIEISVQFKEYGNME
ncbi:hypothetical protein vseg_010177 [Gypsophila vaccaria]